MRLYPEHEKLYKIKDQSQTIGEFIEWLQGKYTICNYNSHLESHPLYTPTRIDVEKVLSEYFEIDLNKLEKEKCQALAFIKNRKSVNDNSM